MRQLGKKYRRIVIKIGASLLYGREGKDESFAPPMEEVAAQIADLIKRGREITIVSSGAIAAGTRILKMKSRPRDLVSLQAIAAVGQHRLMNQYHRFFKQHGLNCAQLLLTRDDFSARKRYLNAKHTLLKLLELNLLPVINENDTVSVEEIKFGDNDRLSAQVASLISADLLIILTDVDGLLDKNKQLVSEVKEITPAIKALACPSSKEHCVGGMVTKIEAAKIAVDSGIPCVIANGSAKDIILSLAEAPENYGTIFVPKKYLAARKRWLAFGARPRARIIVDEGARRALIAGKSLLSVGVAGLEGNFSCSDVVSLTSMESGEFARGKARIASSELERVMGRRSEKEVVHRDDIVIL